MNKNLSESRGEQSVSNAQFEGKSLSFQKQLEDFIDSVSDYVLAENKNQALIEFKREVIRYILKIQKGMGSTAIKSMAHRNNFIDDWVFFKQMYLDMSFYVNRRLWKAIVIYVKDLEEDQDEMITADVNYCISQLTTEDIEKIKDKKVNTDCNLDHIDMSKFETGKRKKRTLPEYFASKTGSLKFLATYDPAMEQEDFEQDLAVEFFRVANYYEQSAGSKLKEEKKNNIPVEERFMKYAETALNNKVLNLKEHWSCESRRRVSTTDNKLYRLQAKLKKDISKDPSNDKLKRELEKVKAKLRTSNGDYFSTVTPLVRGEDGEFRELDAREIGTPLTKAVNPMGETEDTMWINQILTDLPSKVADFVNIICFDGNEEFERWFDNWAKGKKVKYNTNNFDHRVKGAFEYCGVTRDELKKCDQLLKFLERKKKGTWDHFFKDKNKSPNQILVKHRDTNKIVRAFLKDDRDDGSCIFSVTDPKYKGEYDTAYDNEWKVVHRPTAM